MGEAIKRTRILQAFFNVNIYKSWSTTSNNKNKSDIYKQHDLNVNVWSREQTVWIRSHLNIYFKNKEINLVLYSCFPGSL